jgi:hypothetical protein
MMMILLGLLLLSAPSPVAGTAGDVRVAVREPSGNAGEARPIVHLFGGREARLDVEVTSSSRRTIDLTARLVQTGSGLTAPLGRDFVVFTGEEVGPGSRVVPVRFATPRVKRASDLELRLAWRDPGDPTWHAAGVAALRVHPADLVQPLRSIAASRTVLVLDVEGNLASFLRHERVPFIELTSDGLHPAAFGSKSEPESAVAIWVRGGDPPGPGDSRRTLEKLFRVASTVVVLAGGPTESPTFTFVRNRHRTRVEVATAVSPSFAHDPRSQQALVEAVLRSVSADDPLFIDPEGGMP